MPKYKSVLVEKSTDAKGGVGAAGQVAWVPVDDAARITSHAEDAIQKGQYKRSHPDEVDRIKKAFKAKEAKANAGIVR